MTPAMRRRLRTLVLAVVATAALFWGAIDLVGVPPENLLRELSIVAAGLVLLVAAAAVAGSVLALGRRRYRARQQQR